MSYGDQAEAITIRRTTERIIVNGREHAGIVDDDGILVSTRHSFMTQGLSIARGLALLAGASEAEGGDGRDGGRLDD